MVKSIETYASFAAMDKTLHILEGEKEVRSIDLEKYNKRGIPENMVTIKQTLDKYLNDGYTFISSNGIFLEVMEFILLNIPIFLKNENKN